MNTQQAVNQIHMMNSEELNSVVAAVKLRRTYLARIKATEFQVGDSVGFVGRKGPVRGTIQKVNPKNILVKETNSHTVWRVPATMLKLETAT
jgi:DNA-directed RNA polymerase subunit H (RpoH/RPB5)